MSLQFFVEAWQADVPPLQRYVLVALSELCASDGFVDYWGGDIDRLCELTGLSRPAAEKCVRGLIATGAFFPAHGQNGAEWIIDSARLPGVDAEPRYNAVRESPRPRAVRPVVRGPGYVYLLESGGVYKIGRSNTPGRRIAQISPVMPYSLNVICTIFSEEHEVLEAELHERFRDVRLNGEWFDLTEEDVNYIRGLAE
jgi:hypothetical protein